FGPVRAISRLPFPVSSFQFSWPLAPGPCPLHDSLTASRQLSAASYTFPVSRFPFPVPRFQFPTGPGPRPLAPTRSSYCQLPAASCQLHESRSVRECPAPHRRRFSMVVARAGLVVSLLLLTAAAVPAQEMPNLPTPGPEHAVFRMDEGTWDAVVELQGPPGAPPMQSKGVEVNTVGCNGLCLITEFTGDVGGMPFAGHGIATWDPAKKKYVSS